MLETYESQEIQEDFEPKTKCKDIQDVSEEPFLLDWKIQRLAENESNDSTRVCHSISFAWQPAINRCFANLLFRNDQGRTTGHGEFKRIADESVEICGRFM